ncbi:MAG TPA: hypothetical protein VGB00_11040 [Pyrinomonadaceae bacterium]
MLAFSVSCAAYLYANRNQPVLFGGAEDERLGSPFFTQNPFRDKSGEIAVESFLNTIKGKEIEDSSFGTGEVIFKQPEYETEKGKLSHWRLQNRIDKENEATFLYYIYRENPDPLKRPKNNDYLLSFVILKLHRENSVWKVKEYNCIAISWNDW